VKLVLQQELLLLLPLTLGSMTLQLLTTRHRAMTFDQRIAGCCGQLRVVVMVVRPDGVMPYRLLLLGLLEVVQVLRLWALSQVALLVAVSLLVEHVDCVATVKGGSRVVAGGVGRSGSRCCSGGGGSARVTADGEAKHLVPAMDPFRARVHQLTVMVLVVLVVARSGGDGGGVAGAILMVVLLVRCVVL